MSGRRIAVTGGIAEGKTTVLRLLGQLGYQTASSDEFARECFSLALVQQELSALLRVPAPIQPRVLRDAIAASDPLRRAVNRLFHPLVVDRISQSDAQFIEVPLLIETCLQPLFDGVWVVTCGPTEQLKRLTARNGAEAAAELIHTQLNSFVKTPFADAVLRTNADIKTVMRFVEHAARVAIAD